TKRNKLQMHMNTWKEFRQQVYACRERRADALFRLCDGLLSESRARSLPERAHSPFFERQWPSVSGALADGKINLDELQKVCPQRAGGPVRRSNDLDGSRCHPGGTPRGAKQ